MASLIFQQSRNSAEVDTPETDDKLLHYTMEEIRLNGTFDSYRRSTVSTTIDNNNKKIDIKPGEKVFVSFVSAARDLSVFPDPEEVKTDRPISSYIHYGIGEHICLGKEASMVALTAMLRTVAKLKNLRRAPGPQDSSRKFQDQEGFMSLCERIMDPTLFSRAV
jgi:linoleate 10R-lipoxygenase